ncbi:MAG: hypothetical protein GY716_02115 [bacterium]|nr:hypothetical protein [bacterium]
MTTETPGTEFELSSAQRGLLCLLLFAVATLALHGPVLDKVALNPDESQYEATASYLIARGQSGFALPFGTVTTFELYRLAAVLFGPYSMVPVRVLVLLICVALAWLFSDVVQRGTHTLCGLFGGLILIHYMAPFEGFAANREWFSSLFVILGIWLHVRGRDGGSRRLVWLGAAGVASGLSLWFKLQCLPQVLVVPALLAVEAGAARAWAPGLLRIAVYAAGGTAAVALHVVPFALGGGLGVYVDQIVTRWTRYVQGNESMATDAGTGWTSLGARLFVDLPYHGLPAVAYLCALGVGVAACVALFRARGRTAPSGPGPLLALYLLASCFAVGLGGRYFLHYYQYLVPPIAGLFALAAFRLATASGARMRRATARIAAGVLLAYALWVCGAIQTTPRPRSIPHHERGFDELLGRLHDERDKTPGGDSLFVWGWAPEIYSLARMEAASQFAICQYIVGDYEFDPRPELDGEMAARLMQDLTTRPPGFIVDASRRSWTMERQNDPWVYRLHQYPEFAFVEFLEQRYTAVGIYDDCTLYRFAK